MNSGNCYHDAHARRTALKQELDSGMRLDGGDIFLQQAFQGLVPRRNITRFLTQSKSYDIQRKRWHILPDGRVFGEELYAKVHKLLKEIFRYRGFTITDRKLVNCDECSIDHCEGDLSAHELGPTFMILGRRGSSFKEQNFPSAPRYVQCVSFIQMTTSCSPQELQSHITLMATYARQCFIEQHNRINVYAVLLTKSQMWFIQFNRSGVTYSAACDFHSDPYTFIRVILGLASDETRVGFDTSIFWERGKRWIRTKNQRGRRVVYMIKGDIPIANRLVLIGRATRCWRVVDPYTNKEYILKDIWRLIGDQPEADLLETARGLPGVCLLINTEEDSTKNTMHLRGTVSTDYLPTDRVWCRMTLEAYGESLEHFSSGLQLLEAYKDVVLAMLSLWERNILHRDISINNVLFGKQSALPGNWGVLIDFDRATYTNVEESTLGARSSLGTRAFQSITVLRSDSIREEAEAQGRHNFGPYPHDHLDDLESLFYILCWICYQYESPGVRTRVFHHMLERWASRDPESSADAKCNFLLFPLPPLSPHFQRGSAFKHLLEKLQKQFLQISQSKSSGIDDEKKLATLREMCQKARSDFELFVDHIDQAIEEWNRDIPDPPQEPTRHPPARFGCPEDWAAVDDSLPSDPPRPAHGSIRGTKRVHPGASPIDDIDAVPSPKRRKTELPQSDQPPPVSRPRQLRQTNQKRRL